MTVLVVDDSEDIRELVMESLRSRHWELSDAADGALGLAALSRRSFDLVLTDITMPNMDGIALIEAIRRQLGNVQMPIVVMSSVTDEDRVEQAFLSGANAFIEKPFTLKALNDCLDRILMPKAKPV